MAEKAGGLRDHLRKMRYQAVAAIGLWGIKVANYAGRSIRSFPYFQPRKPQYQRHRVGLPRGVLRKKILQYCTQLCSECGGYW